MARDSGWDAHDCEDLKPFVCQRADLPLPALSQTHNFETCDGNFHKEGCQAGASHLAFSVPPQGGGLERGSWPCVFVCVCVCVCVYVFVCGCGCGCRCSLGRRPVLGPLFSPLL